VLVPDVTDVVKVPDCVTINVVVVLVVDVTYVIFGLVVANIVFPDTDVVVKVLKSVLV